MPQSNYKDYNNYSQRDKESMRTAAADASVTAEQTLVTQTDDVEPKLTSIDTSATTIKTDVGNIKTNVGTIKTDTALIKTHVQTIQSNTSQVEYYLSDILTAVNRLAIRAIPESVTLEPGSSASVFIPGADLHDAQVYVEGFGNDVTAQVRTGGIQYIDVIADNMANPGAGMLVVEFDYGPDRRTYVYVPITVTGNQQ